MKKSKIAIEASSLVKKLRKIIGPTKNRKALLDLCQNSWKPFAIERQRDMIYKTIGKDSVRTIQGVLDGCEMIIKILTRPGVLNAETRLAACWFQVNNIDDDGIDKGRAQSVMAYRLSCTKSEYDLGDLEKTLPKESVVAIQGIWDCYAEFCMVIAKGIEKIFDYSRIVRFYIQYFAIVRYDEIAEIIHSLRVGEAFTREQANKLFSGEEIRSNRVQYEWDTFDLRMRAMNRLDEHGNVRC